jgi:hypothetical protein
LLVPPEFAVTGALALGIKIDWITLRADICSPTPLLPSNAGGCWVHLRPHVTPSFPPLQEDAAAAAEARRRGMMIGKVQLAIWVVAAIQRER